MNSKNLKREVLKTLDQQARKSHFPLLDSLVDYWYFGAIRLTIFRSPREWLMAFDSLVYNTIMREFNHLWFAYGNLVQEMEESQTTMEFAYNIDEAPGYPISSGETGAFLLNKWDFSLLINKELRRFSPTRDDYRVAGVDVDDSSMPVAAQILRLLVFQIGEDVFLSPSQLLRLWKRAESDLVEFLVLREWYHPDIIGDQKPSDVSTFQMLAVALANNDPGFYAPDGPPNTHWSNWPMD